MVLSIVAWARFYRNLPDSDPVFSGMTMETNETVPPTKDRMPMLAVPADRDTWLHDGPEVVIRFPPRLPFDAAWMRVQHADDAWRSHVGPPARNQDGSAVMPRNAVSAGCP
ncbi:hypothetical protein [uncultured Sphingomonas sp.]|uniref:hypothetical protein n=1 Tax=uncultured Sphingomonas sp. TaxID=158754 RepID=UPI0037496EC6